MKKFIRSLTVLLVIVEIAWADGSIIRIEEDSGHIPESKFSEDMLGVPMLNVSPVIDGILDDNIWQQALLLDNFLLNKEGMPPAEVQTSAYIFRTEDTLYLAFQCNEPQMENMVSAVTMRDGNVWEDDCVEIFLDTNRNQHSYYHFIINSVGTVFDQKVDITADKYEKSWNSGICAAAKRGNTSWAVECGIPLRDITGKERNDVWGVNLCRERRIWSIGKRELSSWSPLTGSFHQPGKFRALAFQGREYTISRLSCTSLWGENILDAVFRNEDGKERKVLVKLEENGATKTIIMININASEEKNIQIPFAFVSPGEKRLSLSLYSASGKELYYRTAFNVSVPKEQCNISLEEIIFFPNETCVGGNIKTYYTDQVRKKMFLEMALYDNKTVNRKITEQILNPVPAQCAFSIRLDKLSCAEYILEITLKDINGKTLYKTHQYIRKIEAF